MKRAFTLIEVLIGMALLAVIVVCAFTVLQWALVGSLRQQCQTRAAFLAQQQMESLLQRDEPKSSSGELDSGFRWVSQVQSQNEFLRIDLLVTGPSNSRFRLTTHRRKDLRKLAYRTRNQLFQSVEDQPAPSLMGSEIPSQYSLSPEGSRLAYVANYQGKPQIFGKNLPGQGTSEPLFIHPQGAREPRFSPDGKLLAFTSTENGYTQVFVWNFFRQSWVNWCRSASNEDSPAWFPDSRRLLTSRNGNSIVEHTVEGNEVIWVPESQGWNTAPDTDGSRLVFMSSRDGTPDIYSLDLKSKALRKLTDGPAYDNFPQIRATRVLFQSNRDGYSRVYSMNLDGSELSPATPENERAENPTWSP